MKNCIECNEQLDDDAKFCSNCRAKQPKKIVEPKEEKLTKKAMPKKQKKKPATVKKSTAKTKKELTYQERRQAIYEMTSRDNCGECRCTNCMQFAMQAASDKNSMELSDCPYIDEDDAEEFLNNNPHEGKKLTRKATPKKQKKKPASAPSPASPNPWIMGW